MQAIQSIQADKEIDTSFVSCHDCRDFWQSAESGRRPLCGQNVGIHITTTEEQTKVLMYAVSLLSEERIARASEYETWAFGEILSEHVPFYSNICRVTIQACYKTLSTQPSNPKVAFALEFFEKAYNQALESIMNPPQDEEVYSSFVAEYAYSYDSDMDE